MKALIKGGLFLALGWLTGNAGAQDMQWKAAAPRNTNDIAAASPAAGSGVRGVSLSMPVPLDASDAPGSVNSAPASGASSFVPISPKVRAQAAEIFVQPAPLPMPKDSFAGPPPAPLPTTPLGTSPVWDSIGAPGGSCCDSCGTGACCADACGPSRLSRFFTSCDDGCCPDRGRIWMSAEAMLWFLRPDRVPPLVTTSPAGVPLISNGQANAGALGQANTSVVYNTEPDQLRVGGRFDLGYWFARCPNLGIEVNYFTLGQQSYTSTFSSNGNPQLFRPFFNVDPANGLAPQQFTELVAVPNLLSGTVSVSNYSELWGIEGLFRYKLCCGPTYWVDLLFGYRFLSLSEGVDVAENLTVVPARGGANIQVNDSFQTRNEFSGLETGIEGQWHFLPRWSLDSTFKLAMGGTYEMLNINGSTTTNGVTQSGGLLALQGTNIGQHSQERFAVLPEVCLKVCWDITPRLQLFVGYDFLCLSTAVRPGETINPAVNPNFLPGNSMVGPRQPAVLFNSTSFWAQGVNLGLMYRF